MISICIRREFPVYILDHPGMTTFKEDSLLSATAFGLGGVGYHPGSCVEDITEMQRKIARSQDFAFQKVNTLSQEHAKKKMRSTRLL